MTFSLDPELATAIAVLLGDAGAPPPLPVGDVSGRRTRVEARQRVTHAQLPRPSEIGWRDVETTASDGHVVTMRWYEPPNRSPGPAVLHVHGGGMILSDVDLYDGPVARYVAHTGVPFLSVEFRYAPEHPAPTPVTDCYAALQWLVAQAEELDVDPARIAVMGDSGGGGIAASLALYARDQGGPALARQILVYPMLDDRTTSPDPLLAPFATWTWDDNATGWGALLGDGAGGTDVSPYAAAARADTCAGLPPAYLEVGELDIFRDECLTYAARLLQAGVSTELHVHPGAIHAYDALAPTAGVSRRAFADRHRVIAAL